MENTLGGLVSALKTDAKELVEIKLELFRLEAFEKSSAIGSFLIYGLVVMNLILFALLFAFLALAFLFGKWINSLAGGFAAVTVLYLVLLLILFFYRKKIVSGLKNVFLKVLDANLNNEEE
jgi:uncharacterized membrane protein YqjE